MSVLVLHGNNVDSNRGCQALRLTTQMILDRHLPGYRRLHANIFRNDERAFAASEPDAGSEGQLWETRRRDTPWFYCWGAPLVCSRILGRFPPMKANRALRRAAALLALGGDNLSYDYGFLATLLFFSPIHKAIATGIPTTIWGASIGPFTARPAWERRFAEVLRRVDLITVREPVTQEYLDSLGVRDNVRRVVDPAFLLPACPVALPDDLERALAAGAVGLNLAPLMVRYNGMTPPRWRRHAASLLAEVRKKTDRPIVLIPHVMMPPSIFPHNDDYRFMESLLAELPPEAKRDVLLYDARRDSCKQIKGVIARLRVFIGSRFHSVVAAISSGVPSFCISYGIKSRGIFLEIFGHDRWILPACYLDAAEFGSRVESLLQEEASLRRHLQQVIPAYAQRAWASGEHLRDVLAARGVSP